MRPKKHIDVDISEIKMSLREGVNTLSDAIDNMNLDGIMSILGIIQYSRLAYTGAYIGPLDQAGFVSDTKNILEKNCGCYINFYGRAQIWNYNQLN
ncbi:hypothetical protein KZ779_07390 [Escherichia coli]|nr:hypothetical protein [Escherichia coli]